jgi:hypothetical protein
LRQIELFAATVELFAATVELFAAKKIHNL